MAVFTVKSQGIGSFEQLNGNDFWEDDDNDDGDDVGNGEDANINPSMFLKNVFLLFSSFLNIFIVRLSTLLVKK